MAKWPYSTARWQRLRRLKLQAHPLCEACMQQYKQIEPATEVDHRIPINGGGDPFPALEWLASLCARCHNSKTRYEQLGGEGDWMHIGCDIYGMPNDPSHPWNREKLK